jgi:hypothetical protein
VITNVIKQFIDANFQTLGSLAVPTRAIDEGIVKLCEGVKFDMEVVDKVNKNKPYMQVDEQRIVLNSTKGMYQGMKTLALNNAAITDYGIEILAESL